MECVRYMAWPKCVCFVSSCSFPCVANHCRRLHACAEQGDYTGAEAVIRQMRDAGHQPGPRAHHALIFSYVKGRNSRGALDAIRTEVSKGMYDESVATDYYMHTFKVEFISIWFCRYPAPSSDIHCSGGGLLAGRRCGDSRSRLRLQPEGWCTHREELGGHQHCFVQRRRA